MAENKMVPFNKEIIEKMNKTVQEFKMNAKLELFEKAYNLATATGQLKALLSPEYMAPIMNLQGTKLGFRTDKDGTGGYGIEVVRNCLIEATLTGVEAVGNHFNIIAGNCYITKEGLGFLLNNTEGLKHRIVPGLPRVSQDGKSAAITMEIKWSMNGGAETEQKLEIPIRVNAGMGVDAIIGKATRKARAWLYNNLNDCEIGDGEVEDQPFIEVKDGLDKGESDKAMEDTASKLTGNDNTLFKDEK